MDLLWLAQVVLAYLLGMAFAGSFIGRKYMGIIDIALHKLFKRKISVSQYVYWKYFCGIKNCPEPEALKKVGAILEKLTRLIAEKKE